MPKGRHRSQRQHKPTTASSHQHRKQPQRNAKNKYSTTSSKAARIEEYMASHGIIRRSIIGDGNCLFRAMADQLGFGEDRHREIRGKVVQTILADKAYFGNFIDGDEVDSVDAYCEEMSKDGVWGDDIELEAFRRAYRRPIVIYDASTGTPYVKPFNGDEGMGLNTVHLWKSDCHYESVRNKEGPFDGPSKVIYKDVQLSKAEAERINRDYEDSAIKELKMALPNIGIKELQRIFKQVDGDRNKILEFFAGFSEPSYVETPPDDTGQKAEQEEELPTTPEAMNSNVKPNGAIPDSSPTYDPEQETLSTSMEVLSLTDTTSPILMKEESREEGPKEEQETEQEIVAQPWPSPSVDVTSPKHKGRQRSQESAARKERRVKQERKEAAKRRKQQEKMGITRKNGDTVSAAQEHNTLKAIII